MFRASSIHSEICYPLTATSHKGCSDHQWISEFWLWFFFQGIITWLGADEGIVNSDEHGELPFGICENFSDTEFTATDIHKEVEFTVAMVSLTVMILTSV